MYTWIYLCVEPTHGAMHVTVCTYFFETFIHFNQAKISYNHWIEKTTNLSDSVLTNFKFILTNDRLEVTLFTSL